MSLNIIGNPVALNVPVLFPHSIIGNDVSGARVVGLDGVATILKVFVYYLVHKFSLKICMYLVHTAQLK